MGEMPGDAQMLFGSAGLRDIVKPNPIFGEAKSLGILKDTGKPTAFGKWLQFLDDYTDQFAMNGPRQRELSHAITTKEQGLQQLFDQIDHNWNKLDQVPERDLQALGFNSKADASALRSAILSGYQRLEWDVQAGRFEPELLDKARIRSLASSLVAKEALTTIVSSTPESVKTQARKLFAPTQDRDSTSYQLHWERLVANMQNTDALRRFDAGAYPGDRQIPQGVLDFSAKLVGFGAQLEQAEHNGFLDILKESRKMPAFVESQQDFVPATRETPSNADYLLSRLADSNMRIPSFATTEFTIEGFKMKGDLMERGQLFNFKNSREFFTTSPVLELLRSVKK